MTINWNFPPPKSGFLGLLDQLIGPDATRTEVALQLIVSVLAAILAPLYASQVVEDWSLLQHIICSVLAFDIGGGIITNATSSAKRWYHRPGQGFIQHFGFVLLHLLHLFLVSYLYLALNIGWILIAGGYLLFSAVVILLVPLYLQRPIGMLTYACGLLSALYGLSQPLGLEWFLPLFYLKLLVSHLLKEEPYRPTPN